MMHGQDLTVQAACLVFVRRLTSHMASLYFELSDPAKFRHDGDLPTWCTPVPGYLFVVQHREHRNCGCFRGRRLSLFRPHPIECGEWPMHYLALEHLVSIELPQMHVVHNSYGWIRRPFLRRPFSLY